MVTPIKSSGIPLAPRIPKIVPSGMIFVKSAIRVSLKLLKIHTNTMKIIPTTRLRVLTCEAIKFWSRLLYKTIAPLTSSSTFSSFKSVCKSCLICAIKALRFRVGFESKVRKVKRSWFCSKFA